MMSLSLLSTGHPISKARNKKILAELMVDTMLCDISIILER